jgi:hypothetical protein
MKPRSNCPLNVKAQLQHPVATRVTSEELSDIHAAAFACGVTTSQWLRNAAIACLKRNDGSQHAPLESTILAEIMGLRLVVLNLFPHAIPGLSLANLHSVMAHAESGKHLEVARLFSRTKDGPDSSA